ncbi:MAG: hypothetical protein N3G22_03635 [Candidatus Micrarchaeota archaeon]|nr:hypothetical protein [Candidatus Micrarchaeota archaeon]
MPRFLAGQGATEYLILLAAVMIVGLIVLALLAFFPSLTEEARLQQNQVFWQSQQPLAIVHAAAGDFPEIFFDTDTLVLTFENKGGQPIEILSISPGGLTQSALVFQSYGEATGDTNTVFTTTKAMGSYGVYLAPPHGRGYDYYEHDNILQPGDRITIGISIFYQAGYPYTACKVEGERQKTLQIQKLTVHYATLFEGHGTIRSVSGELIAPCVEDLGIS